MPIRDIALSVLTVFAILIILITTYRYFFVERLNSFSEKCLAQQGHVYDLENRYYCISEDGRWIEIYP